MTIVEIIYLILTTLGVTSIFVLVTKLSKFLKVITLFLDTEVKTTLNYTNNTLKEAERTLNKSQDILEESKTLINQAKNITSKAGNVKTNLMNFSSYLNFGLDIFKKVMEAKKEKNKL